MNIFPLLVIEILGSYPIPNSGRSCPFESSTHSGCLGIYWLSLHVIEIELEFSKLSFSGFSLPFNTKKCIEAATSITTNNIELIDKINLSLSIFFLLVYMIGSESIGDLSSDSIILRIVSML